MGETLNGIGQERAGADSSSLPRGPSQGALFQPARPSWRDFLGWLIRDTKAVGCAVYGGRDPEQARKDLDKVLKPGNGRYFDVEWMDLVLDFHGPEAWEGFVRFVCDRAGYEMPAKKPDAVRVHEELGTVRKTLDSIDAALRETRKALEHVERGVGR